jgi:hypothetical protein
MGLQSKQPRRPVLLLPVSCCLPASCGGERRGDSIEGGSVQGRAVGTVEGVAIAEVLEGVETMTTGLC